MTRQVDVLIAGGGPCGLVLAIELGRRGVRVLLVNDQLETAFNPQANATSPHHGALQTVGVCR